MVCQCIVLYPFRSESEDEYEDDVRDEDIDNILIVTQTPSAARRHDRTGMHVTRAKMTSEIAHMINDGLYYYELDLQSTSEVSYRLKKVGRELDMHGYEGF